MSGGQTNKPTVAEADMPALYQSAGKLSETSQSRHLQTHRWLLSLLIAGAVASALASSIGALKGACTPETVAQVEKVFALLVAFILIVGLFFANHARTAKSAGAWYDGRALAESAKSMAWKYMMRAPPYQADPDVDDTFCKDLKALLADSKQSLPPAAAGAQQITPRMHAVRALPMSERLDLYLVARVQDQRDWYAKRSTDHGSSSNVWFTIAMVFNLVAVALALVSIVWSPAANMLGVVTTVVSSVVAWTQIRRFSELAHSYAFTSHEIGLLQPKASAVNTDDELARFVADCETAFSREHTMWRARREISDG
jgi:hypothetical protein